MEQIKLIFFALASFFGIEDGRIVSEKTTITITPENKEIEIIQQNLFTIIKTEEDSTLALDQWNKILYAKQRNTTWSKELDSFPVKSFDFTPLKNTIQPHLILNYSKQKDLRAFGIWYNQEKNQFSINNIPQHNINTNDGKLEGNYLVFNAKDTITFTIEPFLQMPENYQRLKRPLEELLKTKKK